MANYSNESTDTADTLTAMETNLREMKSNRSAEAVEHLEAAAHLIKNDAAKRKRCSANRERSNESLSGESLTASTATEYSKYTARSASTATSGVTARSAGPSTRTAVRSYLETIAPRQSSSSQRSSSCAYQLLEIALFSGVVAVNIGLVTVKAAIHFGEALSAVLVGLVASTLFTYKKPQVAFDLVKTTYHLLQISYENGLLTSTEIYNIVTRSLLQPMTSNQIEKEYQDHVKSLTFREYGQLRARAASMHSRRTMH